VAAVATKVAAVATKVAVAVTKVAAATKVAAVTKVAAAVTRKVTGQVRARTPVVVQVKSHLHAPTAHLKLRRISKKKKAEPKRKPLLPPAEKPLNLLQKRARASELRRKKNEPAVVVPLGNGGKTGTTNEFGLVRRSYRLSNLCLTSR
jgi:hypothetical protein